MRDRLRTRPRSTRGLAARLGLAALVLLVLDQVLLHTVLADGRFLGVAVAPFDPPLFAPAQVRALERIETALAEGETDALNFDAELGWCPRPESGHGEFRYDWAGCRIADGPPPREKRPGVRRIVTIGCSMTHGDEVGARETWCAQLDRLVDDVEVANLGVPAFGLDQALLRLLRDGLPLEPDEVWLGFLPAAARRPTTRYLPIVLHWSLDVGFKPRYRLGASEELELLPNPARTLAEVPRLLGDQHAFLGALAGTDPWLDRAPLAYAPRGSHAAHWSFLGRLLLTLHESAGREAAAHLADPDHATARLLAALCRATRREAEEHGARFRLLLLPGSEDLADHARRGEGYWRPWADGLRARGMEVIDLTGALRAAPAEEDLFEPMGHYTPHGNRIVAEELARRLEKEATREG